MQARAESSVCPRCGARNPGFGLCAACLLEESSPPVLGGDYELQDVIGQGGSGTVYRARHRRLGRTVAVKVLAEPLAAETDVREQFDSEARLMALLDHPRIVAVHDVGRDSGHSYIVMEHVEGTALTRLLPLPPRRALSVAGQVCEALAYAHAEGVVHGDVKPANVLVEPDGSVKLTDFGTARLVDSLGGHGTVAGTRPYMAPEALAGDEPDPRMDVYSFGVLLHEMLTGRRPSAGLAVTGPLAAVILRAIEEDPARRYPSIAAVRRDMERASEAARADGDPADKQRIGVVAALNAVAAMIGLRGLLDAAAATAEALRAGTGAEALALAAGGPLLAVLAMGAVIALGTMLLELRWQERLEGPPVEREPFGLRPLVPVAAAALVAAALRAALILGLLGRVWLGRAPVELVQAVALFFVWTALLDARRLGGRRPRQAAWTAGVALTLASFAPELVAILI